jgi:hypothetical protein
MAVEAIGRVGILWRGDRRAAGRAGRTAERLRPLFDALASEGVEAEAVVFDDEFVDEARAQILTLDGVLVWVDPVMGERDRTALDALLREVARQGVWVSAHPDVILKIGTKEILVRTRDLSCGSDSYIYRTEEAFRSEFPSRVAADGPRVLKRYRGNAGIGVWKVQVAGGSVAGEDVVVEVQDAAPRTTTVETMALADFVERCEQYFAGEGCLVDQPFLPRIAEGMIRCYLVRNEVAGFSTQAPDAAQLASGRVFGLPSAKTMYAAWEPRFASLRAKIEQEWAPAFLRLADVDANDVPMLWDADFLLGPRDAQGEDTYVLCEINVSSVLPFPETVPGKLARAVAERLGA